MKQSAENMDCFAGSAQAGNLALPSVYTSFTNHLGNVLTTVSDIKLSSDANSDGFIDLYSADITSSQDYYPGGSLQPGRNWKSANYRYSMNGQEMDNEITGSVGTHTTAMFWEYDSRLGRRWNLDPKGSPDISSFASFSNNPIQRADPYGDTDYINSKGEKVGNDSKSGNGVVIVVSDETAIKIQSKGVAFEVSELPENTYFELPSYENRQKIKDEMNTLPKYSYYEIGGQINEYENFDPSNPAITTESGTIFALWEPGETVTDIKKQTPSIPETVADKSLVENTDGHFVKFPPKFTWHSHPNGTFDKDGKQCLPVLSFDFTSFGGSYEELLDDPSSADLSVISRKPGTTGIVMGTNEKKTTLYNSTDFSITIDFSTFYNYQEEGEKAKSNSTGGN